MEQWTLQGLLDELDTIEVFKALEHNRILGKMTTKQKEIYKAMDITFPLL
ncbi:MULTISPECIES: hypothetical protein [Halolactibacillus]|nr:MULTISPECIES: hypothetical protein [Halolactibacillus]